MRTVDKVGVQGDVFFISEPFFFKTNTVPSGYNPVAPENGLYIVAHSETGHHHTINANTVTLYRNPDDIFISYLEMLEDEFEVVHHRTYDTHGPLRVLGKKGDIFRIIRQREYTPNGLRRVED